MVQTKYWVCIGTRQTDCAGKLVKGPLTKWSGARQATVQVVIVSQDGHFSQINHTLFRPSNNRHHWQITLVLGEPEKIILKKKWGWVRCQSLFRILIKLLICQ